MAKIAKLFRSLRERKTVGKQAVIAITQEITSGIGMSLDADERHVDKGKTEHSTAGNFIGLMLRRKTNDGRHPTVDRPRRNGGTCSRRVDNQRRRRRAGQVSDTNRLIQIWWSEDIRSTRNAITASLPY